MVANEQKIIDKMTLQCEKEKEELLDQLTKSMNAQHEIKIKDLEKNIAELKDKDCEPVIIAPKNKNKDEGFPDEGVKIMIEMEKDGNYTIK